MILKFFNSPVFERVAVVGLKYFATSALVAAIVPPDSWRTLPSIGGLAIPSTSWGITYLSRNMVSRRFLLSASLFKNVLGVASPSAVVPNPTIVEWMLFSVAAADTWTYQLLFTSSYWTGCPRSPDFLSETLLSTVKDPPLELIVIGLLEIASFKVLASFSWCAEVIPEKEVSVIAK